MSIKDINKEIASLKLKRNHLIQKIKNEESFIIKNGGSLIEGKSEKLNIDEIDIDQYIKLKDETADVEFLKRIQKKINNIPTSNGTEFFEKIDVNIGIVADEFLYNSFKDVANFVYITLDNYKEYLEKIDVFVLGSAWKGLDGKWKGLANPKNVELRERVSEMINCFKEKNVKTVFYSKEDPTNYDRFVDLAKLCDYIFTTAREKVQDYIEDCDNTNVSVLEFGVNPIYNNPIALNKFHENYNKYIFAGSWYKKYPKRQFDTKRIFDSILNAKGDLKIVDRNYQLNNTNHLFPVNYLKYITPPIPHEDLQKVLKLFPWAVNLNSVQNSETMFANRVYELQAMGNLIVSNYSLGINNKFPNIFMLFNNNELRYIYENVPAKRLYESQLEGIRNVLRGHTTYHRIVELLNRIGIEAKIPDKVVGVVVEEITNKVKENFNRQSYYNKVLIRKDELETHTQLDYITFFNPDYSYDEYYLEDLVNGFKFTNSDFVTKDLFFEGSKKVSGIEHDYVEKFNDKYLTMFSIKNNNIKNLLNNSSKEYKGYAIDSTEVNLNGAENQKQVDFKISVIIPIYNNGKHLYNKCLFSLERSSMFNEMEIILVDDGSTDLETKNIIHRINRNYSNVLLYEYNDGGSGSASRPRNKGVELATTDYITFLDPDNEAVNDGYTKLYQELLANKVDMVVGNIVRVNNKETKLNYFNNVFKISGDGLIDDTFSLLINSNLKAQSIQALLVKKKIIEKNNIKMVEGAAGQDTLFFQELLINCNRIKAIDTVIHLYYAEVSNSVTNDITSNFFGKYLKLEKERIKFLESNKLLKHYVNYRLDSYFKGWYLVRVPRLKRSEYEKALNILFDIYNLYKPYLSKKHEHFKLLEKAVKNNKYEKFVEYCKSIG